MAFLIDLFFWYGARNLIALALVSAPSRESPEDAPVSTPILKGFPFSCSAIALSAIAAGIALGAPAGVNPLNPTLSPSLTKLAASSAVINLMT